MFHDEVVVLLRLNKSWHEGMSEEDLYEITCAWWVMSLATAEQVTRVLAVAGGVVREAYQPTRWMRSPVPGLENRVGFAGAVAPDREGYVGRDVSQLFRRGSANPVRYLPLGALTEAMANALASIPRPRARMRNGCRTKPSNPACWNEFSRSSTPSRTTCSGHSRGQRKNCSTRTRSRGCCGSSRFHAPRCSTSLVPRTTRA